MAQGEFTPDEAKHTAEAAAQMFEAIAKNKRGGYLGHLNDVGIFCGSAAKAAALLNGLRGYFLEKTGEESPFVKRIDELMPRRQDNDATKQG